MQVQGITLKSNFSLDLRTRVPPAHSLFSTFTLSSYCALASVLGPGTGVGVAIELML